MQLRSKLTIKYRNKRLSRILQPNSSSSSNNRSINRSKSGLQDKETNLCSRSQLRVVFKETRFLQMLRLESQYLLSLISKGSLQTEVVPLRMISRGQTLRQLLSKKTRSCTIWLRRLAMDKMIFLSNLQLEGSMKQTSLHHKFLFHLLKDRNGWNRQE